MCSNSFRPSVPHFPHHPCINDSQSELHPSPPRAPAPAFRPGHWRRRTVLAWYCLRVRTHLCLKPAPLLNSQPPSSHLPALPTYAGSFQFYASFRFPPPRLELRLFHPLCQAWATSSVFVLLLEDVAAGMRCLVSGAGNWEEGLDTGRGGEDKLGSPGFRLSLSPHRKVRTSCHPSTSLRVY